MTLFAAISLVLQVSGTSVNPAISFSNWLTSAIMLTDAGLVESGYYTAARILAPFLGAALAGCFYLGTKVANDDQHEAEIVRRNSVRSSMSEKRESNKK